MTQKKTWYFKYKTLGVQYTLGEMVCKFPHRTKLWSELKYKLAKGEANEISYTDNKETI